LNSSSDLALVPALMVVAILVAWYSAANFAWYRLVRAREPDIHGDAFDHPLTWVRTVHSRLRRGLALLLEKSDDEEFELWRLRTLRRLAVTLLLSPFILVLAPITVRVFADLATTDWRRGGLLAVGGTAVLGLILAYYSYRLTRAIYRFGNARPTTPTEFVVAILGILAAIVGAVLFTVTPVGPA
jgi:hypothetical protein